MGRTSGSSRSAQRQALNELVDISFKLDVAVEGRDGIRKWLNYDAEMEATEEVIDELFADFSGTDAYAISAPPNEHVSVIVENLDEFALAMYVRSWTLVSFQRKSLATCDHPVVMVSEDGHSPVGPLNAPGFFVPLSRKVGLFMGRPPTRARTGEIGVDDHHYPGKADTANMFNQLGIANAREAIFTHPDDVHLTLGLLPQPRRQEVTHPDYKEWFEVGEKLRSEEVNPGSPSLTGLRSPQEDESGALDRQHVRDWLDRTSIERYL